MTDSTEDFDDDEVVVDDNTTDDNITEENPEDAGSEEDYDTPLAEEVETEEEGLRTASSRTYPILIQIVKYYPGWSHMYVTSTTGGHHAANSLHYRGEAIDVGSGSQSYKDGLAAWLYKYSSHITELIHSRAGDGSGWYVKNGVRRGHSYYGRTTTRAHVNHVHFGIATVSQANAMLGAVKKGATPAVVHLKPVLNSTSTGTPVRLLQTKLNAKGYRVAVDGHFGPSTLAAVKAFQKAHGLRVDGEVGVKTWQALG